MVMYDLPSFLKKIVPHVTIFRPSLTIIMDDGDQYFEKKIMYKNLHNATC